MELFSHWSEVPDWVWDLMPNFHPSRDKRMASPDTGAIRVHLPSYAALQRYRELTGPTHVISGYRSPRYNALRGGAPRSQHKELIAWDVALGSLSSLEAEEAAREAGFTGLGRYPSQGFIHMDMGRPRFWWGSQLDKRMWEELQTERKRLTTPGQWDTVL